MASKSIFQSYRGKLGPRANTVNEAGGRAYALPPKAALAQLAATGCLNATFYVDGEAQLEAVLNLCVDLDPEFVAKTAIYAREKGFMKDMPALLVAYLASFAPGLAARIFDRVIDDGKMVRNFVQVLRSGATGRKSLGSGPKRLVESWLASRDDEAVFRASVGNDPSLADVVRMVRPRPATPARSALYAYLIGKPYDVAALPEAVRSYEAYKTAKRGGEAAALEVPDVPFQLLTALDLGPAEWTAIARRASWQMTRMNLNTFARQGVFGSAKMVDLVAARLCNAEAIERARAFPYQLLAASRAVDAGVPPVIREALVKAMEVAVENVPALEGKVYVLPDVSGSMRSPVTGVRRGATTAVRCVDVAALVAAALVRKKGSTEVLAFDTAVHPFDASPRESVLEMADRLAAFGGGGTSCSLPLAALNARKAKGDLVIYISDNESWVDVSRGRGTLTMQEWTKFRARNPAARLVCIDIQPSTTTQAADQAGVLNIGGFSDEVFRVLAAFARGESEGPDAWVRAIEEVTI